MILCTHPRTKFATALILSICGTLVLLILAAVYSPELFLVLALLEAVLLRELAEPGEVRPSWQKSIDRLLILGLVIFAGLVVRRIVSYIPSGVF